jgi:hypothetical protein
MTEYPLFVDPRTVCASDLPWVRIKDIDSFPSSPAIYLVFSYKKIQYVGQTTNLNKRWIEGHHRDSDFVEHGCKGLFYVNCHPCGLDRTEKFFIAWFNPPLNQTVSMEERTALREVLRATPIDGSIIPDLVVRTMYEFSTIPSDTQARFDRFWAIVQKRKHKASCMNTFIKITEKYDVEELMVDLTRDQEWHMKNRGHLKYLSWSDRWLVKWLADK